MKFVKKTLRILLAVLLLLVLFVFGVRAYFVGTGKPHISKPEALTEKDQYEAIIVLGAGVYDNGELSPMLRYRLEKTLEIWETRAAKSIFLSGDHREGEYDEVDHMREYLVKNGVPDEAIWYDYEGYSTCESMCRAANVYNIRHAIVITQEYHLYRAMYIGRTCGMELTGVPAQNWQFSAGTVYRTVREWGACIKDLYYCIFKKVTE